MTLIHALILGIVEGLTEFLPVSSTAHLIFASKFLGIPTNDLSSFFEVFIQSGSILAVILLYMDYILKHKNLILTILISFIPTAIIGLLLHKVIKNVFFNSPLLIIYALCGFALLFLIVEYSVNHKIISLHKDTNSMQFWQAILIGLVQALAVIPGISRAGAVIVGMMFLGYKREEATRYSFLLAIPTVISAGLLDLLKADKVMLFNSSHLLLIFVGFFTAFIVAFIVVKWFINYMQKNTLIPFAIYRIIVSLVLYLLLVIK